MIELRGTIRNLAKWFRLCVRLVDRSPRMERNTDIGATVVGGPTSTGVLTRGQMARALREGGLGEARSGGTGGGVIAGAISRVDVRKYLNNRDLRSSCGCVTLAMLMAATITVAPTAGIPRNSANVPSSGPQPAGSIPRTPSPSVGDGNSVHPYVSDVNQGHQKKMLNKITGVTAAAVVGIAATVAGAQSAAVQWRVEDGGNGHWYQRVTRESRSWSTLREFAERDGGHLATLTSLPETNFLVNTVLSGNFCFIGGFQLSTGSEPAGDWQWVTGEAVRWTNWAVGEPNNYEPSVDEDVMAIWGDGLWADVNEKAYLTNCQHAIVEWSADCNNDNIVDYGQCQDGSLPDTNTNNIPDCCEQGVSCNDVDPCASQSVLLVDDFEAPALDSLKWDVRLPYACSLVQQGGGEVLMQARGHLVTRGEFSPSSGAIRLEYTFRYIAGGEGFEVSMLTNDDISGTCCSQPNNGLVFALVSFDVPAMAFVLGSANLQITNVVRSGSIAVLAGDTFHVELELTSTAIHAVVHKEGSPVESMTVSATWAGTPLGTKVAFFDREFCDARSAITNVRISRPGLIGADCDTDGISDACEIASGAPDINHNNTPDTCECIGDIDVDGTIDGSDLGVLLAYWGPTTSAAASIACDLNVDGVVNGSDLGILLAYWGPCSN